MTDYIPEKEPKALVWMQNFANGIAADCARYMLSTAEAAVIVATVEAYAAAIAISSAPATRTPVATANKDDRRNAAMALCRQFAIRTKNNAGISDGDKIAIGVRPVNRGRQPIQCPQTAPLLNIIAATPGAQTLRYADSMTPDAARKPFGATELQLFVAIADGPVADANQARFYGKFTKNPVGVAFDPSDNGKQATYFGRWSSRRGDVGPWSLPVTMTIAA